VVGTLSIFLSVVNANVVLYHRIFHPSFQSLKYLERGTLSGDPPTLKASESLAHDIETLSKALKDLGDPSDALYQVAMTSEGDASLSRLDYSSVKACHLQQAHTETWILHAADDDVPFALDYFVSPIPSDGARPKRKALTSSAALRAFADSIRDMNTTIIFKRPTIPPQPDLRIPPQLTAEGEAVQPPPQKSFIQKYWIYIIGFLLVMIVASPEDPEQPRNNGQPSS